MSGQKVLMFCCVSTLTAGGFVDLPVLLSVAKQPLRGDLLSEPRRSSLDRKCPHQADVQSAVTLCVSAVCCRHKGPVRHNQDDISWS